MTDDRPALPLSAVVGRSAKRVREDAGAKLDDVARAARRHGLDNWGTGRVSDLEHGKVSPTGPTLVVLCLALTEISGRPMAVRDLIEGDEMIALATDVVVTAESVRRFLSGEDVVLRVDDVPAEAVPEVDWDRMRAAMREQREALRLTQLGQVDVEILLEVKRRSGEAESKMARTLGVSDDLLAAAEATLWGSTLSAERDRRAGPDDNAQKRGRITRDLKAELATALKAVIDGDNQ